MDVTSVLRTRRILREERRRRERSVFRGEAALARQLRYASNPFEMPEIKFRDRYRLSRQLAHDLVEELSPLMKTRQRATGIPIHLRVLAALHFFGHGSNQKGIGADSNVPLSQPSVSLAISEVVDALNVSDILSTNIIFLTTPEERAFIIQRNYRRSSIPGVLGYVDGAHVHILAPQVHEEQYVNRKEVHSLNVQVVVDSDMIILNILARFPGSTHDSFIWSNSAVRRWMEELYRGGEQCWLLGDSGYPSEPWLHVPYENLAEGSPEANFNKAHMIDRSVVERTIGHLRNRFRCLSKHRVLEYAPVKAGLIVNSCAVLHNKCVKGYVPAPQDADCDSDDSDEVTQVDIPPMQVVGRARGRLLTESRDVRNRIAARVPTLPPREPFNPRRPHRRL